MSLAGWDPKKLGAEQGIRRYALSLGMQRPSPLSGICQLAIHRVDDGAQENTVLQADVEEHGRPVLVDAGVEHCAEANRGKWSGKGLEKLGYQREKDLRCPEH